jgi:hypothetical protein
MCETQMQSRIALAMFITALGAVALTNRALSQLLAAVLFLGTALFVGLVISGKRRMPVWRALLYAAFPGVTLAAVLYALVALYGLKVISGIDVPLATSLKLQLIGTIGALAVFGDLVCIVMSPALISHIQSIFGITDEAMTHSTKVLKWILASIALIGAIATAISTGGAAPSGVTTIDAIKPHP